MLNEVKQSKKCIRKVRNRSPEVKDEDTVHFEGKLFKYTKRGQLESTVKLRVWVGFIGLPSSFQNEGGDVTIPKE